MVITFHVFYIFMSIVSAFLFNIIIRVICSFDGASHYPPPALGVLSLSIGLGFMWPIVLIFGILYLVSLYINKKTEWLVNLIVNIINKRGE